MVHLKVKCVDNKRKSPTLYEQVIDALFNLIKR